MSKIILDLCGGTGAWSKPYKDAGYIVQVLTMPNIDITKTFYNDPYGAIGTDIINFCNKYGQPIFKVQTNLVYGILAAPPCTMFSMARTIAKTPRDLQGAMEIVKSCLEIIYHCQYSGKRLAFWAMENPKGRLRWFMGLPAMTFNPYDFGDAYRKPTDLWGNFNTDLKKTPVALNSAQDKQSRLNLEDLNPIPEDYVRDPNMTPRAIARSITHTGFAKAFYEANK